MGYIGSQPATNFETVRKQVSTTNSGTTITLDYSVSSVQDILVTVNAVVQSYDNYTVSGTTLTLGGTLNNDRVEILYVGRTFQTVTPAIGTVTSDMLAGSIANSKLANSSITLNGSAVSLGGSTSLVNTPSWLVKQSTAVSLSDFATTKVTFDVEELDTDSAVASSRFTVPSGQAGNYYLFSMIQAKGDDNSRMEKIQLSLRKNGTGTVLAMAFDDFRSNPLRKVTKTVHTVANLSEGDYVEVYIAVDINAGTPYYEGGEQDALFGGYKLIGT